MLIEKKKSQETATVSSKASADKEYMLTCKMENMYLEKHMLNSLFSLTAALCWSQMETLNPPRDTWIAKVYQQSCGSRCKLPVTHATNQSKQQFHINGIPKTYPGAYLARSKRSPGSLGIFLREITSAFNYSKAVYYCIFLVLNFKIACIAKIEWNGRVEVNILSQLLLSDKMKKQ